MPITKLQPFNLDTTASYTFGTVTATNFVGNGSQLTGIVTGTATPTIATIGYVGNNTATDVAGGETITLTGTGFSAGCSVIINGAAVGVVSFVSSTQVTFVAPALSAGTYILYLVNTNGATAISVPGISYSGTPSFYTAAGSVGAVYEASAFNSNVAAAGDSAITYTVASGTLPTGATLNANGVITGTSVLTNNTTTYTFGVNASDGQNQDVTRSYTITVNPDVITWSSPTNNATISLGQNSASSTTLTAVSAAGKAITYTANALPSGLSISGNVVTGTPTVLGNTTSILTANATSTTRSATVTVVWNVAVLSEPYFIYNSLLLSGEGTNNATNNTFVDSSTNNFAITRAGNTTQGTISPYGANWSTYNSDTADSGFGFNTNAALNMGTGDFTVEAWVNTAKLPTVNAFQTSAGGFQGIFATGPNQSATGTALYIGTTNLKFDITSDGSGPIDVAHNMVVGQWYHVAVSRSGNTFRAFINGSLVQTATSSAGWNDGYGWGIQRIEPVGGYSGSWWYGYVSNFRAVKGTAVYTSAFTPSTTPLTAISGTSLLTCQSNRFKDNSSNNFSPVFSPNPPTIQRFSPFSPGAAYNASTIGGSGYLDGSGDYLTAPTGSANFGTGDFTIEGWVNFSSTGGGYPQFLSASPATAPQFAFTSNTQMYFYDGATTYGPSFTFNLGSWHHVAWVRAAGVLKFYVNGVSLLSVNYTSAINLGAPMVGGYGGAATNGMFHGYISNLRVVTGTAVYTSTFTPPTAPVSAISGTSLLLNFTNAGIIDGAMQNNIETIGDTKISTTQSKFGSSSIYFDGTGDYLTFPTSLNLQFGTGNFTIELWTYLIARGTQGSTFIGNYNAYTAGSLAIFAGHSSANTAKYQVSYNGSGFPNIQSSTSIIYNQWAHIAVVRSGTTITLYINGVADGTITGASAALNGVGSSWFVGTAGDAIAAYNVNGYIDDVRITKGVARYTANFTPPTTALSTQ